MATKYWVILDDDKNPQVMGTSGFRPEKAIIEAPKGAKPSSGPYINLSKDSLGNDVASYDAQAEADANAAVLQAREDRLAAKLALKSDLKGHGDLTSVNDIREYLGKLSRYLGVDDL